MNRTHYIAHLADGSWQVKPTPAVVRDILNSAFPDGGDDSLLSVQEADGESDTAFAVTVDARWKHAEAVRDCIAEALLRRCRPEYESMVEVEVLDE